jgi:hypothetical protein
MLGCLFDLDSVFLVLPSDSGTAIPHKRKRSGCVVLDGNANFSLGGLDTVLRLLGNLSSMYVYSDIDIWIAHGTCIMWNHSFFLQVPIHRVLPQVCDHPIVVFASDGFYNFVR